MGHEGNASISVNLASVTGMIDMEAVGGLEIGGIMPIYVDATLNLLAAEAGFDAPMVAVRLSESRVMVVSDGMAYISTADKEIDTGVELLLELANLPGFTRTGPITVRLVFDKIE